MKHLKRTLAVSVASALSAMVPGMVSAIGFGRVVPAAVLGQPLDFTVPLRVDPGEPFDTDCARVQVWFGEGQLPPSAVRTEVIRGNEGEWRVHVRTTLPVTEPVVEVGLSAGCDRAFTRRFTAFADPPGLVRGADRPGMPGTAVAQAPAGEARDIAASADAGAGTGAPATPRGRATGRTGPASRPTAVAQATPRGRHAAPAASREAAPAIPPAPVVVAAAPAPATVPSPAATPRRAGGHARATVPAEEGSRLVLDQGQARLKLDMDDPVLPPGGAHANTASAALAAASSELDADPDARRLRTLEQNLEALRRESQASRDQTAALSARLAQAETRADWLPWLLAALGLSLVAIGGLGWRLRQATRPRQARPWFEESAMPAAPGVDTRPGAAAAGGEAMPETVALTAARPPVTPREAAPAPDAIPTPEVALAPVTATLPATPPAAPTPTPTPTPPAAMFGDDLTATRPLSRAALAAALGQGDAAAPRELSVEELLDLEQQADFFIALGQEDAAVDLLMSHLRSAGGQSPLPYTKLLEIYRRQGDRAAYERMRARFNRRFNAYAPDWDVGPTAGRLLEDYPESIAAVQSVWHSPIDAMAMLEALLFKRDDTSELFDLPAYHDILLLYSLARDLWQQSGEDRHALVDVLLPLEDAPGAPVSMPAATAAATPAAGPAYVDPWGDPSLPPLDATLLPVGARDETPTQPPPMYEPLPDLPLEGGVQATLDASRLEASATPARGDASNDEAAPPPGARREPGARR